MRMVLRNCTLRDALRCYWMKILTAHEMQVTDQVTSDRFGISSLELMERAGTAVARFVSRELPQCRRIVVLCGKGNNGGDGLVAARHLLQAGCAVAVLLLGDPAAVQGDAKVMLHRLAVPPIAIAEEADLARSGCKAALEGVQLFLDAVVGTGFRAPMRGLAIAGRTLLERYPRTPVVAVDLPSGWEADSRDFAGQAGPCIRPAHARRPHPAGQSAAGADRGGADRFAGRGD
jgi:hydroxyethylthiazole kinase-like uncharacterized protein yjeF